MKTWEARTALRAFLPDLAEKHAERLLKAADYNVERAVNFYFEEPENQRQRSAGDAPILRVSKVPAPSTTAQAPKSLPSRRPAPPAPREEATEPPLQAPKYAVLDLTGDDSREAIPLFAVASQAPPPVMGEAEEEGQRWPRVAGRREVVAWSIRKGVKSFIRAGEPVEVLAEGGGAGGGRRRFRSEQVAKGKKSFEIRWRALESGVEGRLPTDAAWFLPALLRRGHVTLRATVSRLVPRIGHFTRVPLRLTFFVSASLFGEPPKWEPLFNFAQFLKFGIEAVSAPPPPPSAAARAATPPLTDNTDSSDEAEEPAAVEEAVDEAMAGVVENVYGSEDAEALPMVPQPAHLVGLTMKPYQRQALHWLHQREVNPQSAVIIDFADGETITGTRHHASSSTGEALTCTMEDGAVEVHGDATPLLPSASNPMWEPRFLARTRNAEGIEQLEAPSVYFVNKYTRSVRLSPPPPPQPCQGGILADEMGMGKTIELLALVLRDKFGESQEEATCAATSPAQAEDGGHEKDEAHREGSDSLGEVGPKNCAETEADLADVGMDTSDAPDTARGEASVVGGAQNHEAVPAPAEAAVNVAASTPAALPSHSPASPLGDSPQLRRSSRRDARPAPRYADEASDTSDGAVSDGAMSDGDAPSSGEEEGDGVVYLNSSRAPAFKRRRVASPIDSFSHFDKARTLIVAPMTMLAQWEDEVKSRSSPGSLSVLLYHGPQRHVMALSRFDVVVASYGVVAAEYLRCQHNSGPGHASRSSFFGPRSAGTARNGEAAAAAADDRTPDPLIRHASRGLFSVHWRRVILDEAHFIKNAATNQARGCTALHADRRWAVTGTPIQNSISDVFSLLKFLRHEPWNGEGLWQRGIAQPFSKGEEGAQTRLKLILNPILLRRTKNMRDADGAAIVQLPPKNVSIVELDLSYPEREFYQSLLKRASRQFRGFVTAGRANQSYIQILALLLRLRQACDHPFLVLGLRQEEAGLFDHPSERKAQPSALENAAAEKEDARPADDDGDAAFISRLRDTFMTTREAGPTVAEDASPDETLAPSLQSIAFVEDAIQAIGGKQGLAAMECPICLDSPTNAVFTQCAHVLCHQCLENAAKVAKAELCPVCRKPYNPAELIFLDRLRNRGIPPAESSTAPQEPGDTSVPSLGSLRREWVGSAKLDALDAAISDVFKANDDEKIVVFSQFTTMLDLVGVMLRRRSVEYARVDGTLSQPKRAAALRAFHETHRVLIVSLKTAGVGLNLVCANHVFMLDPWWNGATEDQAIDRVHRLGQKRAVHVTRFIVRHSVEEKILAMQEKKRKMASAILQAGQESGGGKLSVEELAEFFA